MLILFSLAEVRHAPVYTGGSAVNTYKKVNLSCLHTSKETLPSSPLTKCRGDEKDKNKETDKRTSETTRETSFNFEAFRALTGITANKISDG